MLRFDIALQALRNRLKADAPAGEKRAGKLAETPAGGVLIPFPSPQQRAERRRAQPSAASASRRSR